jgi:hypothetical protein
VELLATDTENLRGVGLSRAKTVYLRDLAERLADGRLDLERLRKVDDDAARAELMQVKGVGRFTADGVLMFALRRPDIWPAANLALRRAVERVWELSAACVDRRHRLDRRPLSPLANARRPLSLSIRSPRGIELPHRAANHRGNTACAGLSYQPSRRIAFPESRPAQPRLAQWPRKRKRGIRSMFAT